MIEEHKPILVVLGNLVSVVSVSIMNSPKHLVVSVTLFKPNDSKFYSRKKLLMEPRNLE